MCQNCVAATYLPPPSPLTVKHQNLVIYLMKRNLAGSSERNLTGDLNMFLMDKNN